MTRSGSVFLVACAALLGGMTASALVPHTAYGGDEVKKLEALKKKRDEFRKKKKEEGLLPFFDLMYAANPKNVKETRWTQVDPPPFSEVSEEKGVQFHATWSPDITKGAAITMTVQKFLWKQPGQNTKYVMNWQHAGIQCDTSEHDKMLEGIYLDEKRQLKDVKEKKCVKPKKKKTGQCDGYASVWGTDPTSSKPTRKDYYKWTDSNTTWLLWVTFDEKFLEDPGVMEKAEELIGTFRELNAPEK